MKIILMGTGPFAVPSFEAIAGTDAEIVRVWTRPVVSNKSRQGSPQSPVRDWATDRGLPVDDPASANDPAAQTQLRSLAADLMVVCDYGQILSAETLGTTRLGGLNLHGSLLPRYRGAAPVQWAVLNGDPVTGVSVIHMTPKLDGGPIVATAETAVGEHETSGDLEQRLAQLGVGATLDAVDLLQSWDGQSVLGTPQDPAAATRAPRLAKADGAIDWGRSAAEIDCHVRGMQPWPVAFTHHQVRPDKPAIRLAVHQVRLTGDACDDAVPGEIRIGETAQVATDDQWVELVQVKPAGKREMSGIDFFRGHKPAEGARLFE
ncbi:MAG: methionyl-tRNA formyltransferase [Planctomycetota bacterium]